MKKISLLCVIFLILCCNSTRSQTLILIDEKEIFDVDFSKASQLRFQFSNKKTIGSYIGIPVLAEIDNMLKMNSVDAKTTSIIISFESNNDVKYYTYFDFLNEISAIPPYLITQQKVKFRAGDTLHYYTKGGKQTADMDIAELTEHAFSTIITNVRLQFNSMEASMQQNIFSNSSLIFPIDQSPKRWLANIKKIKIYKIE